MAAGSGRDGKGGKEGKDERRDRREDKKDKKDREKLNITGQATASMASLLEDFFFEKDTKFADICRDVRSETVYCRNVAEVLCFLLLPEEDFSDRTTRLLLREMLTTSALLYSANIFSDPDYVNQTIAMGIENSYLTFQALKAAADHCSLDELEAIKENIDLDITFRLKDETGRDQSTGIAERAQKNKREIEELLVLKRHCERRIQLFATGQKDQDEGLQIDGTGLAPPEPSLSSLLEDDSARHVFGGFLETLHALPLLAFWRSVEWYRNEAEATAEATAGFSVGDVVGAAAGYPYPGGTVRYVGPCIRTGEIMVGVELTTPAGIDPAHGEPHDDHPQCFDCAANTGVLFRPAFLQSFNGAAGGSGARAGAVVGPGPVVVAVPNNSTTAIVQGIPVATGVPAPPTAATSESERRVRARGLNEMFLKTGLGQHLGLPEDITGRINTRIADDRYRVHLSLFDDAQQYIFRHLDSVCLPQFKATKHYDDAVNRMAARFADDGGGGGGAGTGIGTGTGGVAADESCMAVARDPTRSGDHQVRMSHPSVDTSTHAACMHAHLTPPRHLACLAITRRYVTSLRHVPDS